MAQAAQIIPFPTKRPNSLVILDTETADRLIRCVKDTAGRQKAMSIRAIQLLVQGSKCRAGTGLAIELQDLARDCVAMSEIFTAASDRILADRPDFI